MIKNELLVIKCCKNKFDKSLKSFLEIDTKVNRNNNNLINTSSKEDEVEISNISNNNSNTNLKLKEYDNIFYNIEKIYLIRNYIESINLQKILCELDINKLKIINFTANCITDIPLEINSLTNLEILVLNNNKIKTLENIDKLKNLKRLELKGNMISEITNNSKDFLVNSTNLLFITLSCNALTIDNMRNFLFEFDVNDKNSLTEIKKSSNLKELGLFGNKLGVFNYNSDVKISSINEFEINNFSINLSKFYPRLEILYISGNGFHNEKNFRQIINTHNNLQKIV